VGNSGDLTLLARTGGLTLATSRTITTAGNILLQAQGSTSDITQNIGAHLVTSGSGKYITLRADNSIIGLGSANITTQGGAITLNSDRDASSAGAISLSSSNLTSNGGDITLGGGLTPATAYAWGTATNVDGVRLNGGALNASMGNINIYGVGNQLSSGKGVNLSSGSMTANSGSININGIGGEIGTGNDGIYQGSYTVTNTDGAINFTGFGGGNGGSNSNMGIQLWGATISGLGNASITLTGTGTENTAESYGLRIRNGTQISTVLGNIIIDGTANGSAGIDLLTSTIRSTSSGNITLIGNGTGIKATVVGVAVLGDAAMTGNIILNSNNLTLYGTVTNRANFITQGNIYFTPRTTSTVINLGTGTSGLALSQAELDTITSANKVIIGDSAAGTGAFTLDSVNLTGKTWGLEVWGASGSVSNSVAMGSGSLLLRARTGNITLNSGAALSSIATGDAISLATAGNFINNSGSATPITVTGGGRYLVYSTNPALDTLGGLVRPNKRYNFAYGSSTASLGSGQNYFLYSIAPALTVTATAQSRFYGDSNPGLTYTLTGGSLIDGDTLGSALTGSLSTAATVTTAVGSASITQGTLADGLGYSLTYVPGTLTITARPLTVTADIGQSKVYGNSDPALSYGLTSGSLVNGDSFSGALVRAAGENTGSYSIGQGSLTAGSNYSLTYVSSAFAITARPLTVTADSGQGKVYGNSDPALSYALTSGSLVGGDSFSGTLSRAAGENAGSYTIGQGTLTAGSNYSLSYVGATFSINARPVTVTATNISKIYGAADPTLAYTVTHGALVNSDSFSGVLTRAAGDNAGSYAISQNTLNNSNYAITFVNGSFTINKAALTILANDASKTYGDATPIFTASYNGLKNNDTSSAVNGLVLDSNGVNAGSYAITASGASATNYDINYVNGAFTINKRPVTITANSVRSLMGSSNPSFTVSTSSLATGDTTAVFADLRVTHNALTNNPVAGSYRLTPFASSTSNYDVSTVNGIWHVTELQNDLFIRVAREPQELYKMYTRPQPLAQPNALFISFPMPNQPPLLILEDQNGNIYIQAPFNAFNSAMHCKDKDLSSSCRL
jgi:hypothetical protein